MNYKLLAILLIAIFLFSNVTFGKNFNNDKKSIKISSDEKDIKKWTVMYYLCYDNNPMYVYKEDMFENLTKIGSNEDLNLVVCFDGLETGDSEIIYINKTGEKINLNSVFNWPDEVDTSNPNTLEIFCTKTINHYPAENYALIPHVSGGRGWQEFCIHDSSDGSSGVSIPKLSEVFGKVNEKTGSIIDVLFVSCANGMIEFAYELRDKVDYIIGMQDCFPEKTVIPQFTDAVRDLHNNTSMTPLEFSCKAPENLDPESFYYYEEYKNKKLPWLNRFFNNLSIKALHTVKHHASTAVIDNSKIVTLKNSVDNLSEYLLLHISTEETQKTVNKARNQTIEYGKCNCKFKKLWIIYTRYSFEIFAYDCFVDLYDFVDNLKNNTNEDYLKKLCDDVIENLNKTIPEIKKTDIDRAHGLSIHFPETMRLYNYYTGYSGNLPKSYGEHEFLLDTKWDEFLISYLET